MTKTSRVEVMAGILFAAVLLMAPTVKAETVLLVCVGNDKVQFSPGITINTRQVSVSGQSVVGCVGQPINLISASVEFQGTGPQSCLVGSAPFEMDIAWNDGSSSHAVGTTVLNLTPTGESFFVLSAGVVSGRFTGASILRTLNLQNTNFLGCFTPQGVTDIVGPSTLLVTAP